jgi:hypothetical protein
MADKERSMDELKLIRDYMALTGCDEKQARAALIFLESKLDREQTESGEQANPDQPPDEEKEPPPAS